MESEIWMPQGGRAGPGLGVAFLDCSVRVAARKFNIGSANIVPRIRSD
jgi:hypothetical protein